MADKFHSGEVRNLGSLDRVKCRCRLHVKNKPNGQLYGMEGNFCKSSKIVLSVHVLCCSYQTLLTIIKIHK